jgi:hypothetical protein
MKEHCELADRQGGIRRTLQKVFDKTLEHRIGPDVAENLDEESRKCGCYLRWCAAGERR